MTNFFVREVVQERILEVTEVSLRGGRRWYLDHSSTKLRSKCVLRAYFCT